MLDPAGMRDQQTTIDRPSAATEVSLSQCRPPGLDASVAPREPGGSGARSESREIWSSRAIARSVATDGVERPRSTMEMNDGDTRIFCASERSPSFRAVLASRRRVPSCAGEATRTPRSGAEPRELGASRRSNQIAPSRAAPLQMRPTASARLAPLSLSRGFEYSELLAKDSRTPGPNDSWWIGSLGRLRSMPLRDLLLDDENRLPEGVTPGGELMGGRRLRNREAMEDRRSGDPSFSQHPPNLPYHIH